MHAIIGMVLNCNNIKAYGYKIWGFCTNHEKHVCFVLTMKNTCVSVAPVGNELDRVFFTNCVRT